MKDLEETNNRLRRMVAKLTLENNAIKNLQGKVWRPDDRREQVELLLKNKLSGLHACRIVDLPQVSLAV